MTEYLELKARKTEGRLKTSHENQEVNEINSRNSSEFLRITSDERALAHIRE